MTAKASSWMTRAVVFGNSRRVKVANLSRPRACPVLRSRTNKEQRPGCLECFTSMCSIPTILFSPSRVRPSQFIQTTIDDGKQNHDLLRSAVRGIPRLYLFYKERDTDVSS